MNTTTNGLEDNISKLCDAIGTVIEKRLTNMVKSVETKLDTNTIIDTMNSIINNAQSNTDCKSSECKLSGSNKQPKTVYTFLKLSPSNTEKTIKHDTIETKSCENGICKLSSSNDDNIVDTEKTDAVVSKEEIISENINIIKSLNRKQKQINIHLDKIHKLQKEVKHLYNQHSKLQDKLTSNYTELLKIVDSKNEEDEYSSIKDSYTDSDDDSA